MFTLHHKAVVHTPTRPPDTPPSFLHLGFRRRCIVGILSAKPTELAYVSPLGFSRTIKPYRNELSLLRAEGVEEERDASLSALLHITDADRITDLELTAPKRLRSVIFFFFPSLRCDVFNRPLRYGLFGDVAKLAAAERQSQPLVCSTWFSQSYRLLEEPIAARSTALQVL